MISTALYGQPANDRPLGGGIRAVAFSPDGGLLAATLGEPKERGRVVLWEVATRKKLWESVHNDGVAAVDFAPDGKSLAIAVYDHTAQLLDTRNGKMLRVFRGHKNSVRAVAFAPDGKTLATGGWDQAIKLWDPVTGEEKKSIAWPADRLYSLCYSPGGKWLMAAGGHATVWDAATGKQARTVKPSYHTPSAVFVDDDWFFTAGNDGTIRLWNIATGEERMRFHGMGGVGRVACSPKARILAHNAAAKGFEIFDFTLEPPTPKEKGRIRELLVKLDDDDYATREEAGKAMLAVGFVAEPELRRAMKASPSAEVRIRCRRLREEMLTKPRARLYGHADQVEGLAIAADGQTLASGSRDGTVRLWDIGQQKEIAVLTPGR